MSNNNQQPKNSLLIVILGPTASGKSDLAIKLAKKFDGEIICADSRTVYKELDIGTAKPGPRKYTRIWPANRHKLPRISISKVPHYLLDVKSPNENFTVADFKEEATPIIQDIQNRKKIPFLVGGTGLYISAIVDNLDVPCVPPDKKLRKKLEGLAKKYGADYLYQRLIKLDPEAKEFVSEQNIRRIIRALEVCLKTKKPFSQLRQKKQPLFKTLQIGIKISRKKLYQNIDRRVDKMLENDFIKEVKKITKKYSTRLPSLSGLGYRQIDLYLKNKIGLAEAIELIKKETRHYAKRQITWFKRDKRIKWIDEKNISKIKNLINKFIPNH